MPGREIEIDRTRDLARQPLRGGRTERAVAECRQDAGELHAAIEVGPGDVNAVAGQDVAPAVTGRGASRTDPHDREVGRATADVRDEHDLLDVDAALVVERRGERLVLELHLGEARKVRGLRQGPLRGGVADGIVVDEEDRSAQDHLAQRRARRSLCLQAQVAQVADDHIEIAHRTATADIGGLLDQTAAEDALHRAHQATVQTVDVGGDGGTAELAGRPADVVALDAVEHRGRHRHMAGFQLDQPHRAGGVGDRDGGVGGSEVDGAVHAGWNRARTRGRRFYRSERRGRRCALR